MATIVQIIRRGQISVPLSANYNSKQGLYDGALAAPTSPVLIAMVTDALNWANNRQEIYSQKDLLQIADYLIWLTGRFGLEASQFTGGGGSVTPIVPGGQSVNRIDFIVNDSSPIVTGGSTLTISSFIGFNLEFDRNGVPQSALTTEPTYFTWSKTTGQFTCSPALEESEVVALIPV
jgi:hypothetical protein